MEIVDESEVPRVRGVDFLPTLATVHHIVTIAQRTLSVAILNQSSKFFVIGITRFMGVMAVPATSGIPFATPSCCSAGVWGLFALSDIRRLPGVADARIASSCLWCMRLAFSCRSSFSGILDMISAAYLTLMDMQTDLMGVLCGVAAARLYRF